MTSNRTFGQDLSAWLHDDAAGRVPDHLDELLVRTAGTRQRPWWSSPQRWFPMDSPLPRTSKSRPMRLLLLAGVVLIALVLVAVAIGGARPSLLEPPGLVPPGLPTAPSTAVLPNPSERSSPAAPSVEPPGETPNPSARGTGSWSETGSMARAHTYGTTATLLQDGRVLVVGGEVSPGGADDASTAADLYDPTTGRWAATGSMHVARRGHVATLLSDGRVLVAGGWDLGGGTPPVVAELYDPASGTWSDTGPMTRWRYGPRAVLLLDGRVLVAGGYISGGGYTKGAELYDPATGRWHSTPNLTGPPGSSTRLADGRVLVMHGADAPELFDPASGHWSSAARPLVAANQATLLPNGEVLLIEETADGIAGAELYDPAQDSWTSTGDPRTGGGRAISLADGSVLLVGRERSARYDPATGTWTQVPRPPLPRDYALASVDGVEVTVLVRLSDGRVLATEGGAATVFDPNRGG